MDITITFSAPNAAGKFALAYTRPALTGSDKQIAWAEEIRAAIEASTVTALATVGKTKLPILLACDGPAAAEPHLDAIRQVLRGGGPNGNTVSQVLDKMFAETSAKAWIDQRSQATHTIMQRYA